MCARDCGHEDGPDGQMWSTPVVEHGHKIKPNILRNIFVGESNDFSPHKLRVLLIINIS